MVYCRTAEPQLRVNAIAVMHCPLATDSNTPNCCDALRCTFACPVPADGTSPAVFRCCAGVATQNGHAEEVHDSGEITFPARCAASARCVRLMHVCWCDAVRCRSVCGILSGCACTSTHVVIHRMLFRVATSQHMLADATASPLLHEVAAAVCGASDIGVGGLYTAAASPGSSLGQPQRPGRVWRLDLQRCRRQQHRLVRILGLPNPKP